MPTPNDFSDFQFRNQQDDYATKYQPSATGEFDPQAPGNVPQETLSGKDGNQFYRPDAGNRQFSSKMTGDPRELAAGLKAENAKFSELQTFLNNNLLTAGCRVAHPGSEMVTADTDTEANWIQKS